MKIRDMPTWLQWTIALPVCGFVLVSPLLYAALLTIYGYFIWTGRMTAMMGFGLAMMLYALPSLWSTWWSFFREVVRPTLRECRKEVR